MVTVIVNRTGSPGRASDGSANLAMSGSATPTFGVAFVLCGVEVGSMLGVGVTVGPPGVYVDVGVVGAFTKPKSTVRLSFFAPFGPIPPFGLLPLVSVNGGCKPIPSVIKPLKMPPVAGVGLSMPLS